MAKGQQRGNREIKKPKAAKKPVVSNLAPRDELRIKTSPPKSGGK